MPGPALLSAVQWAKQKADPNRSVTNLPPPVTNYVPLLISNAQAVPIQTALPIVSSGLAKKQPTEYGVFGPQMRAVSDQELHPLGRFPKLNEWAARMKEEHPVVSGAIGGLLDYAKNVGTPRLSAQNAAAAAFDVLPWSKVVPAYGAAVSALPMVQKIGISVADNYIPNPFEER